MALNKSEGIVPVHSLEDYYAGYAKTLKVATNIICFVLPIFVSVFMCILFIKNFNWNAWLSVLAAIGSYGCMAFIAWLIFSYITKIFDILSLMAHNVEYIAWMIGDDDVED
jgi:hypothetical protein